jgi:hypothetical protein
MERIPSRPGSPRSQASASASADRGDAALPAGDQVTGRARNPSGNPDLPARARRQAWIGTLPPAPRRASPGQRAAAGASVALALTGAGAIARGLGVVTGNALAGALTNPANGNTGLGALAVGVALVGAGVRLRDATMANVLASRATSPLSQQMLLDALDIVLESNDTTDNDTPDNITDLLSGEGVQASHILQALHNGNASPEMIEATSSANSARELAIMAVELVRAHHE